MSRMSAHGFRVIALGACLVGFAAGCQGLSTTSAVEPVIPADPLAPGGVAPGAGVVAYETPTKAQRDLPKDLKEPPSGLEALAPSNVYKQIKAAAGYGPNEEVARQAYQQGLDLFQQKRYDEAAKEFATAADRWPDTPLEEDALFMQAESCFFADRYPQAHETYEQLLKKHTYSRYLDRAVAREFVIGRYWEKFDDREPHWPTTPNFTDRKRPWFDTWGNALKAYEHVRMNDPTGPLADDSLMAAGNAYFLTGRYEDAAGQYDVLRKEYPKSEHQLKAHLLGMESKQLIYQGPLYDGAPLKDAGEIADHALVRFSGSLGEDRGRVVEAKNRIVELQADRDLALGQYFDKKHRYGAARIYYQAVIKDFPQTAAALAARQRLDQIKDLPAEPPNYFKWLERILGSKNRY